MGTVQDQTRHADTPNDLMECTVDQCANGLPMNLPVITGKSAPRGAARCATAAARASQCNVPSDCGMDSACEKYTCNAGMCPSDPFTKPGELVRRVARGATARAGA
jgi:hypothetical protein